MKLHEYPHVNRELKDSSLREQMEARLRQIDVHGHYKSVKNMSDYALLTAFETLIQGIGYNTADADYKDGFDAGMKFGQERMLNRINETFIMNEGESVIPSSVESIKSKSKIWSNK
jgi:hypothetical protein